LCYSNVVVLRTVLEEKLAAAGWTLRRETAYHRVWSKGNVRIPVPSIDILDEQVAQTILRHAGIDEW
jgi:hypothetical protein